MDDSPRPSRQLEALFDPGTIAVLGASADPAKWGHILARRALQSAADSGRRVLLVNRRAGGPVPSRILDQPVLPALRPEHGPVDLAAVCVPASGLLDAVGDAVAAGARAVVAITAGLSELGPEGALLERQAVEVARAGGAVLVGPNCLGVADTTTGLQLAHAVLPPGEVTVLSQSGNVVLDLAEALTERGLGVARFVSLGNQADLDVATAMRACLGHVGTRAVAVYAEDVVDGRAFVRAARALREAGVPVCLISPGRSQAAVRGAASHTGAMTSASQVVDAACEAAGVLRADHPRALADQLEALLGGRRLAGPRVAVLTDGGGHGAMACDAVEEAGLQAPLLGAATREAVQQVLWPLSTTTNPVDLAGAGDQDPTAYAAAVRALLAADDVDGVLLTGYFGGYSTQEPGSRVAEVEVAAAHDIAEAVVAQRRPVVVHTIYPAGPTACVLREAGVPVHRDVDRAVAALAALRARSLPELPSGSPSGPATAPPLAEASYDVARELLATSGLRFPASHTVTGREQLDDALAHTGFPVVLKALGQLHKSDAGGVVLGLGDAAAAHAAYDDLAHRLHPPAVSVEAMADLDAGVELIGGCVRDRRFGPVVMVGLGGVHAEVLADTATALAPLSHAHARSLLLSLDASALLTGVRGRPSVDLDALAAAVVVVAQVAAAHPELAEVEVNPLLASPQGVLALDARIVLG